MRTDLIEQGVFCCIGTMQHGVELVDGKTPAQLARDNGQLASLGITFVTGKQRKVKPKAAEPTAMAGNNRIRIVQPIAHPIAYPITETPEAPESPEAKSLKNGDGPSGFKDKIRFEKSALKGSES
ncbi:hypothetical protein [Bythopirellula polymerisocia]|uniref:Uncharacterized protein n=1 Tax=Bythopirellula polymerisocia TaxID=2528003 RepID=A0A5C6CN17_9BACT|nr:hypothetical protein [Bythopirellula polymerisocia]TWU24741.1 hypothetical protein Pla144_36270 [Bythopirellula polymerisocia]